MALLAVDGGASKTDVALVSGDGVVLGAARGPGSNHQTVGMDQAMDNIAVTITMAMEEAGIDALHLGAAGTVGAGRTTGRAGAGPIAATGVYCLAGLDLGIDETRLGAAVIGRGWTGQTHIYNDTFAVLRAGTRAGWGVAVVCGTGLNCVGVGPNGTTVRFPSLGELSGDFTPGGAWLGIRGLGLALRAGDGRGRPTVLRRTVAERFGLRSAEAVLEAVYTGELPWSRLAELAETVLAASAAGDPAAAGAVVELVDEVVTMAAAAIGRIGAVPAGGSGSGGGSGDGTVEVVTGGGLFDDAGFRAAVHEGLRRRIGSAVLSPAGSRRPVVGAVLLGLDLIGAGPEAHEAAAVALTG